jgi:hypothetical protein
MCMGLAANGAWPAPPAAVADTDDAALVLPMLPLITVTET